MKAALLVLAFFAVSGCATRELERPDFVCDDEPELAPAGEHRPEIGGGKSDTDATAARPHAARPNGC